MPVCLKCGGLLLCVHTDSWWSSLCYLRGGRSCIVQASPEASPSSLDPSSPAPRGCTPPYPGDNVLLPAGSLSLPLLQRKSLKPCLRVLSLSSPLRQSNLFLPLSLLPFNASFVIIVVVLPFFQRAHGFVWFPCYSMNSSRLFSS